MNEQNDNIVNLVFFIRAIEPRIDGIDLIGTMDKQLDLVNRYGFKASFLLQYDTIMDENFMSILNEKITPQCEIGGWLEVVQPLVEQAGLVWRGIYPWDWHSDVGFSVGYTPEERKLIIDAFMKGFKEKFGYYPKTVGSWMIDAVTLDYMSEKYGVEASCICKDQYGTDGYTLWGGYYGQAYYPSKQNAFCPAQTKNNQISMPVFRMLGSDAIYQYDDGLIGENGFNPSGNQCVVTLEPAYPGQNGGGGDYKWIDWYMKENFSDGISFNYAQAGQENSFGWEKVEKGLEYQFKVFDRLVNENKLRIETMAETGHWFKKKYPQTPATTMSAMSDWKDEGHKSIWYDSRFYRANFYQQGNSVWIRDINKFDENYKERYIDTPCTSHCMVYDNLPVIDGNRWSLGKVRAGIFMSTCDENGKITEFHGDMSAEYPDNETAIIKITDKNDQINIVCSDQKISLQLKSDNASAIVIDMNDGIEKLINLEIDDNTIKYDENKFPYSISFNNAEKIEKTELGIRITAKDNILEIML